MCLSRVFTRLFGMSILGLVLLFGVTVDGASIPIKMGFLFPHATDDRAFVLPRMGFATSGGAVSLALERVERDQLLPNVNLSVVWGFSQCEEGEGAGKMIKMVLEDKVNVVFGPPCSVPAAICGVIAKRYNVAIVSWAATAIELADTKRYPTLIRVIGSAYRMGRAMKEILAYFDWTRVALFYTDDKSTRRCLSVAQGAFKHFPRSNIHVVLTHEIDREIPTDEEIDKFLKAFSSLTRIVLLCIDLDEHNRRFMLRAQQTERIGVDYVYMIPDYVRDENATDMWTDRTTGSTDSGRDSESKTSMATTLFMEMQLSSNEELFKFKKEIVKKIQGYPFFYSQGRTSGRKDEQTGSLYSPFLHDAVILYANALNLTIAQGTDVSGNIGLSAVDSAKGMKFEGVSGHVVMDDLPGREPTFVLKGFTNDGRLTAYLKAEMFRKEGEVGDLQSAYQTIIPLVPKYVMWETRGGYEPKWYPRCGFNGDLCQEDNSKMMAWIVIGSVLGAATLIISIVVTTVYIRRKLFSDEMALMLWKIQSKNLTRLADMQAEGSLSTLATDISEDLAELAMKGLERVAYYQGQLVFMHTHSTSMVLTNQSDHIHLKQVRELSHDNLNPFLGLVLEGHPVSVWRYNSKGSLQDVLHSTMKLDWYFKFSLIRDMVAGLSYLHDSPIKTHGSLKSTNCVVNSRWVCCLTDYGLPQLRSGQQVDAKGRLWTAPELLRSECPPTGGTQLADIYSLSIILQEIIARDTPFGSFNKAAEEIVNLVRAGLDPPFRPDCATKNDADTDPSMVTLMKDCWAEDPKARPDVKHVYAAIKQMGRGREGTLLDHAMKMMERYSQNLEQTINDRTRLLTEEISKSDNILYKFLPVYVADRLKSGASCSPVTQESVTIMFSDLANFEDITSKSTPIQIVNLLNDIYIQIDEIIDEYDVFRVQTVNDTYMVVSGLNYNDGTKTPATPGSKGPPGGPHPKQHICVMADLGLHILLRISGFFITHLPKEKCEIKIGLHTGPTIAGVIGNVMPRFALFGDTVHTARIMLDHAKAGCIHVTEVINGYLTDIIGGYITKPRGELQVKHAGTIFTFWLMGKKTKGIDDLTSRTTGSSSSKSTIRSKE